MIYAGWKSVFQPAFFVLFTIFARLSAANIGCASEKEMHFPFLSAFTIFVGLMEKDENTSDNKRI